MSRIKVDLHDIYQNSAAIDRAMNELRLAYHGDDHLLIRNQIEKLNEATMALAEAIMNEAVGQALKGTNINE